MFLAVASLLAGCGPKTTKAPPPLEAGYVVMTTQSASLNVELAGRTAAYETSDVRPQVTGMIKARHFVEGSIVQAGQTLYEIDPSLYRAAVAQAQANLEFAEASRDAAVVKAARFKPLAALQAVAQQDYADAEAAAKQSIASVAQNRAALETARINLAYTRVPAPITGRIGRSVATTGALATVGQTDPLTTIQRLDPIFVDIQQSSADLVSLQRSLAAGGVTPSSTEVRLILEDGSQYPIVGKLEFSDPMVDQN
ncbi:MAG: efflux RND transporter periplasmic adaptor subunit, partial [Phenylobacterium sp.]